MKQEKEKWIDELRKLLKKKCYLCGAKFPPSHGECKCCYNIDCFVVSATEEDIEQFISKTISQSRIELIEEIESMLLSSVNSFGLENLKTLKEKYGT